MGPGSDPVALGGGARAAGPTQAGPFPDRAHPGNQLSALSHLLPVSTVGLTAAQLPESKTKIIRMLGPIPGPLGKQGRKADWEAPVVQRLGEGRSGY